MHRTRDRPGDCLCRVCARQWRPVRAVPRREKARSLLPVRIPSGMTHAQERLSPRLSPSLQRSRKGKHPVGAVCTTWRGVCTSRCSRSGAPAHTRLFSVFSDFLLSRNPVVCLRPIIDHLVRPPVGGGEVDASSRPKCAWYPLDAALERKR